jgi:putative oxidoreductase
MPELFTLGWWSGVIEFVGGALLALGLLSRLAAFIMSGMMASAYFMAHAPNGFWPAVNKGELAALYSFVFIYIAAAGPGPWSLDRKLGKA